MTITAILIDGPDQLFISISSFNLRIENGVMKYIQIVTPGLAYAGDIADMANALLTIYSTDNAGITQMIGFLPITGITSYEGARNQSITIMAQA